MRATLKTTLKILPALAAIAVGMTSHALIDPKQPPMTMERLLSIFTAHPEVTTLDQVPAVLPNDYLMNFVLKHGVLRKGKNGHLVEKKVSQSADPLAPRAIVFDERTGFVVSWNGGDPKQTANQRLDTLSFDFKTKEFSLAGIDFPIAAGHPSPVMSDCNTCHGPEMRPIFAMYPDWPSFYGSVNDELTGPDKVENLEFADYRNFLKNVAGHQPRYSPLYSSARVQQYLGRALYPSFPYRPDVSEKPTDTSRAFAFRPELRIGVTLNRLLAQHVMATIQKHPRYDEYAPYFLFNLLECSWSKPNQASAARWLSKVNDILKAQPKTLSGQLLDYRQNLALFDLELRDVDMRYSYNHEGYANTDASHSVMEVGYIGRYFNSYFDGSATIDELLAAALYKDLSVKHPQLAGLTKPWGLVAKYAHFTERFKLDANFFKQMDTLGEWIEMPYPQQLSAVHHRESFKPEFAKDYNRLCSALEGELK